MERSHYFKNAVWVGKEDRNARSFAILRGHFNADQVKKATLNILGLGFFKCYINGKCINEDTFLPLSSDFEASCDPANEVLTGHRIYVPSFDITKYLVPGDNVIAVYYGGGWYTNRARVFGLPKAIYCITTFDENGNEKYFVSDKNCRIKDGHIISYWFVRHECQDYNLFDDSCFEKDFDDSAWEHAVETEDLETNYLSTNCPIDKLMYTLPVKVIKKDGDITVYDCGENTVGYPVIVMNEEKDKIVEVSFSEERLEDGSLEPKHIQGQFYHITADGKGREVQPQFTWFGFRFVQVKGNATVKCVKVIYADVKRASTFECDNDTLNWAYNTFIHTMLCNMHTGHPSDCPHLERLGYTGDGQVTCNATLTVLDAKEFYEKWLCDIGDCQDTITGHVQYTAPYLPAGGGPGGYGCAIVEVPYQLYKHYGSVELLKKHYDGMRNYIKFLEDHSEFSLVTSDKPGNWCLGDWCGPNILYSDRDITSHNQQVIIPAPYVNTYFMVKSLITMRKIAKIIGKDEHVEEYDQKIDLHKRAIQAAYFNTFDGNFVMNVQGANSYAVELGLGNQKTYANMVSYYTKLGHLDTGIFATDVLLRNLFINGDADLAVDLLTSKGPQGFENWRRNGATTLHEYWDSNRSRSHCHPMFGSPIAYFFEFLLGIKQTEQSCAYKEVVISPKAINKFNKMSGSIDTPNGTIAVRYEKVDNGYQFNISIPNGCNASFNYNSFEIKLNQGENKFIVKEEEKTC